MKESNLTTEPSNQTSESIAEVGNQSTAPNKNKAGENLSTEQGTTEQSQHSDEKTARKTKDAVSFFDVTEESQILALKERASLIGFKVSKTQIKTVGVSTDGQKLGVTTDGQRVPVDVGSAQVGVSTEGKTVGVSTDGQKVGVATDGQRIPVDVGSAQVGVSTEGKTIGVSTEGKVIPVDLANARFIEIPDGKHLCSIECADIVNKNINKFIEN